MQDVRKEYHAKQLTEQDLLADPLAQARLWVDEAIAAELPLANAMALATVDTAGQPSSRIVLLKDVSADGFTFFTHYDSRKGDELTANPRVSFVMHWAPFDRQLVVMGQARRLDVEASRAYFASRPHASQLSAAISPQSRPISREQLEADMHALGERYPEGTQVPMPDSWGGVLIAPTEIQFWHGRPSRLHDRFRYLKQIDGSWQRLRLAP